MSSSPARAPGATPQVEVRPFPYSDASLPVSPSASSMPSDTFIEGAELAHREQIAREQGRQQGEAQARAGYEEHIEQVRNDIRTAIIDFNRERAAYFQKVEQEVVQLALSIARKVLHRESQVDPLLLAGLVRVALDQVESNTKVTVRVHPQSAADYRTYFARTVEPHKVPEIHDDPALEPDRCVLQTELGTAEIGLAVQLKEIEHGLMDLLAQRPRTG